MYKFTKHFHIPLLFRHFNRLLFVSILSLLFGSITPSKVFAVAFLYSPATPWVVVTPVIAGSSDVCSPLWNKVAQNYGFTYYTSKQEAIDTIKGAIGGGLYYAQTLYNENGPEYFYLDNDCPNGLGGAMQFGILYNGGAYPYKNNGSPCDTPGSCSAGNPVTISTGNKYEKFTDYISAGSHPLEFSRFYNSTGTVNYPSLGHGSWTSNFDRYLIVYDSKTVYLLRGDGQDLHFWNNGTSWISESDADYTLTHQGSGYGSTWIVKDKNDITETYTERDAGKSLLTSVVYQDGYTQTLNQNLNYGGTNGHFLTYNSGKLLSVSDSFGRTLNLDYYSDDTNYGLLKSVTAPDGLVISYSYTNNSEATGYNYLLSQVTFSTTPVTSQSYTYGIYTVTYSKYPRLTGFTDESGHTASWTYDSLGRATSSQHGSGIDLTTIAYNDNADDSRTVTGPLGLKENYVFDLLQGAQKVTKITRAATSSVPAATRLFTYDSNGYLASETDWKGTKTTYVNDSRGQPTSITEAAGAALARVTSITYDSTWVHKPKTIVAPRKTTSYTYDLSGNLTLRSERDTSGGATNGQVRSWGYSYGSYGLVKSTTDPLGHVTSYSYDSSGNLILITNALNQQYKLTSYTASGLPLSMTDPNGTVTTLAYDKRSRLTGLTVAESTGNFTTSFAYDGAGNVARVTLGDGSYLAYSYDAGNRVVQVANNLGEKIAYTRDPNGDITQRQVINSTAIATKSQYAAFDSLGRTLRVIGAASQTSVFAYDANNNLTAQTDPLGHTASSGFDALNRLLTSTDRMGATTALGWDSQDNLASLKDPRNLATSYSYDGFGRVISETSPDRGTISYTLDAAGNRTAQKDARGIVTSRTFDALNRVKTVSYPTSGEGITYSYDSGASGIGRLTSVADESGSASFGYNRRGDVTAVTQNTGGYAYPVSYSYDGADHISSVTYPSGHSVSYTRDAIGRVSTINYKASSGSIATPLASRHRV